MHQGILFITAVLYSATTVYSMCNPVPSYLKLRGGGWIPKMNPQDDKNIAKDPAPPVSKDQSAATQQQEEPPQSIIDHAFQYALAGGMDGIRSGVGQGVGAKKLRMIQI